MAAAGKYILIVEDEVDLADMLKYNMQREGYACAALEAGDAVLPSVRERRPDLILLDRMLPGMSGDDVVTQLKRDPQTTNIPILLVTAKGEETDQLVGFALGADDYITKPFSIKVLLARIAAVFRRSDTSAEPSTILEAGPVRMVPSRHELTVSGRPVHLTATQYRVLRAMIVSPGRVFGRSELLDDIFGTATAVTDRAIDVHITALRKKLGPAAPWIQTIRGFGYTFRQPS
ncbi:MAG: response regulator [Phycisphaerales bacterium]|nr:response regulator [Phycisphaerales bacterium]